MNESKIFVDTNILVYGHDADAGKRHEMAQDILAELWDHRYHCTSFIS